MASNYNQQVERIEPMQTVALFHCECRIPLYRGYLSSIRIESTISGHLSSHLISALKLKAILAGSDVLASVCHGWKGRPTGTEGETTHLRFMAGIDLWAQRLQSHADLHTNCYQVEEIYRPTALWLADSDCECAVHVKSIFALLCHTWLHPFLIHALLAPSHRHKCW